MDDSVFEVKPTSSKQEKKQTPYRWRSCFASEDEYAQYLSDIISPGMTVRCCKAYESVRIFKILSILLFYIFYGVFIRTDYFCMEIKYACMFQIALGDVGQVQKVERDIKQNVFLHVSYFIFAI